MCREKAAHLMVDGQQRGKRKEDLRTGTTLKGTPTPIDTLSPARLHFPEFPGPPKMVPSDEDK